MNPSLIILALAAPLLDVSHGQKPTDTGSDKEFYTLTECKELGGQSLKVEIPVGDSFGDRVARVTDWKPFTTLEFAAFNPSPARVPLVFTLKHQHTVNRATRVEAEFTLRPGRNDIKLAIDDMLNVNRSTPDFEHVTRWYIANGAAMPVTLFFGNINLTASDTVAPAAPIPHITAPIIFNTPEADAILGTLPVFPPDNPWNQDISDWPLHPNSEAIIASIGPDKPFRYNPDMSFVLVPPDQKRVPVTITAYADESDPGPFPIPDNTPIEGWPWVLKDQSLDEVQRDARNGGGDRHGIVVDPANRMLYEFYALKRTGSGWQAAQASTFNLKTNRLRPRGWTSTDAAGLPIFPAVVRYDELKRGVITHALRVTVRHTRRAYVAPARHFASRLDDETLPRMGERIRLRQDFDISGFSPQVQTILKALKKHGMFVADNGIEWAISVAPDERIPILHEELRRIKGANFEVVTAPQ